MMDGNRAHLVHSCVDVVCVEAASLQAKGAGGLGWCFCLRLVALLTSVNLHD